MLPCFVLVTDKQSSAFIDFRAFQMVNSQFPVLIISFSITAVLGNPNESCSHIGIQVVIYALPALVELGLLFEWLVYSNRPLSRRLDRCDRRLDRCVRMIQNETNDS